MMTNRETNGENVKIKGNSWKNFLGYPRSRNIFMTLILERGQETASNRLKHMRNIVKSEYAV